MYIQGGEGLKCIHLHLTVKMLTLPTVVYKALHIYFHTAIVLSTINLNYYVIRVPIFCLLLLFLCSFRAYAGFY